MGSGPAAVLSSHERGNFELSVAAGDAMKIKSW